MERKWIKMVYYQKEEQSNAVTQMALQTPLFLIGFMGVGKSSIAACLGQQLHVPVHEMDDYIAEQEGLTIPEIFQQKGEKYFRAVESTALSRLGSLGPRVISCGGGVPMRAENVAVMRASGSIVLLTARPETVFQRVRNNGDRPLLNGNMNLEYITQLMEERRERYEKAAQLRIQTDGKTVETICREILTQLAEKVPG